MGFTFQCGVSAVSRKGSSQLRRGCYSRLSSCGIMVIRIGNNEKATITLELRTLLSEPVQAPKIKRVI